MAWDGLWIELRKSQRASSDLSYRATIAEMVLPFANPSKISIFNRTAAFEDDHPLEKWSQRGSAQHPQHSWTPLVRARHLQHRAQYPFLGANVDGRKRLVQNEEISSFEQRPRQVELLPLRYSKPPSSRSHVEIEACIDDRHTARVPPIPRGRSS